MDLAIIIGGQAGQSGQYPACPMSGLRLRFGHTGHTLKGCPIVRRGRLNCDHSISEKDWT